MKSRIVSKRALNDRGGGENEGDSVNLSELPNTFDYMWINSQGGI